MLGQDGKAATGTQIFTLTVLGVASGLFVTSGVTLLSALFASRNNNNAATSPPPSSAKPWDQSNVQVTYQTDSTMCDYPFDAARSAASARPVIRAGALLKLIDVVAGVAARRHAGGSCVTVSLDSVLFLSPIHLGDLIHLSAAVNRSFTSSMEVGVRVIKEDPADSGKPSYVSHAYLTFVIKRTEGQQPPAMPRLVPQTPLQWRRHFLAGQRRAKRLNAARKGQDEDGLDTGVRDQVRAGVMALSAPRDIDERGGGVGSKTIQAIEVELLAQALYSDADQGVVAKILEDEAIVEAYLAGDEDGQRIRHPLESVEAAALELGLRKSEGGAGQAEAGGVKEAASSSPHIVASRHRRMRTLSALPRPQYIDARRIRAEDTCVQTLHIVFPEHANSVSILFGGQTMSWMEEAALMSARHLAATPCHWRTVAMDGLEFKRPVRIGEVMTFTAVCLHTFTNSAEVYVVASAETHGGGGGSGGGTTASTRRFTNDALFTLALAGGQAEAAAAAAAAAVEAATDASSSSPLPSSPPPSPPRLRSVSTMDDSPLRALAASAASRKQRRLDLRDMLARIYAS